MRTLSKNQFTSRELHLLSGAKNGVIYDKRLFNKLERLGVLQNDEMTGCRVRSFFGGGWNVIEYISSCESFRIEGIDSIFTERYFSGCFNPYFVKC